MKKKKTLNMYRIAACIALLYLYETVQQFVVDFDMNNFAI